MSDHVVIDCSHPELGTAEARGDDPDGLVLDLASAAALARKRVVAAVGEAKRQAEGERLAGEAAAARVEAERQQKLNQLRERAAVNPDIRLIMEVLGL